MAHDRVGEGRLAGAVRAHQRVDLAAVDLEVEALEDLLVLGADVKVGDLEVGHISPCRASVGGARRRWSRLALRLACSANSTSSASVVPASAFVTPPWTRVHSSFVAQAWSPSVSCEQSTRPSRVVVEALHRRDRPLERLDDVEHLDLGGGLGERDSRRARRGPR